MSHAVELKEQAIKYVAKGGSIKEACEIFGISRTSFQRWRRQKEEKGSVARKPRIKVPYKINNEALKQYIDRHPDAYLSEIALKFKVTIACISIALKRLKITRKKSRRFIKKGTT